MEELPPFTPSHKDKESNQENPTSTDELDTPTSIASVMTSTNESSTETDTPHQTDTEVRPNLFLIHFDSLILWDNKTLSL